MPSHRGTIRHDVGEPIRTPQQREERAKQLKLLEYDVARFCTHWREPVTHVLSLIEVQLLSQKIL